MALSNVGDILLVKVPGVGMTAVDFQAQGLTGAVLDCPWPVTVRTIDPGLDPYPDGSIDAHLLDRIDAAQRSAGANRVWLAGVSLGCRGSSAASVCS